MRVNIFLLTSLPAMKKYFLQKAVLNCMYVEYDQAVYVDMDVRECVDVIGIVRF